MAVNGMTRACSSVRFEWNTASLSVCVRVPRVTQHTLADVGVINDTVLMVPIDCSGLHPWKSIVLFIFIYFSILLTVIY
jgi:hypothetical protein